jgi:thiol-disulfide isomerase/thioredoxin
MTSILTGLLALSILGDVRSAINAGDLAGAERVVEQNKPQGAVTPEWLEAQSWLGRGALGAKKLDDAERHATRTKQLALELLKTRKLDDERRLPIALGAAIEVRGQVLAARGDRAAALEYLQDELNRYRNTSIVTRIQKNINLIGLEGKPAPALEGMKLESKPTLLFFWAHWCGDCKSMGPVLEQVRKSYPGIAIAGPTQLYGYTSGGQDSTPEQERPYVRKVQNEFYPVLKGAPTPISQKNFQTYGASTTPTLVLVDGKGIVRTYHPGRLTFEELRPKIDAAIADKRQ